MVDVCQQGGARLPQTSRSSSTLKSAVGHEACRPPQCRISLHDVGGRWWRFRG